MNRHFSSPTALILALCFGLIPVWLSAQVQDPEGDVPLPSSAIALDLSHATVRIAVGPSHEPGLRWWREQLDDPGSAELSVTRDGAAVVINRPQQPEGGVMATLIIEIAVAFETPVSVVGSDLNLVVSHEPVEEAESEDTEIKVHPHARAGLELQLWQSQASLSGTGTILGSLDDSRVEIRETTGAHDLTLSDSVLKIVNHKGLVMVAAQNADLTSEGSVGGLTVHASGGPINLRSTQGPFKIEARNSQIQVFDSKGVGNLTPDT